MIQGDHLQSMETFLMSVAQWECARIVILLMAEILSPCKLNIDTSNYTQIAICGREYFWHWIGAPLNSHETNPTLSLVFT